MGRDWGHGKGQSGGKGNIFCLWPLPSLADHYAMSLDSQGRKDLFQKVGHLQIGWRYESLMTSFEGP